MSAVVLTGRVVDSPRLSTSEHIGRPDVRCSFVLEGRHSGLRVELHATEQMAERIVATVEAGGLVTATCWSEPRGTSRRLYVESLTVHPEPA